MNNTNKNSDLFLTKKNEVKEISNTNSNNKKTLTIEEYKKILEEYKTELNEELNGIIQQEKEKEDERMKKHEEEVDDQNKKILEEEILKERNESSKRVIAFNE
jgi:hypothetical protein